LKTKDYNAIKITEFEIPTGLQKPYENNEDLE